MTLVPSFSTGLSVVIFKTAFLHIKKSAVNLGKLRGSETSHFRDGGESEGI